jgi:hypothetical protein
MVYKVHFSFFDIYFTEFGAALTTVLPVLFKYCYKYCYSDSRKLWAAMKSVGLALYNLIQPKDQTYNITICCVSMWFTYLSTKIRYTRLSNMINFSALEPGNFLICSLCCLSFYLPIMITPLVSSSFSHVGGIVDNRYLNIIFITGLKSAIIILFNLLCYKYRYSGTCLIRHTTWSILVH